MSLRGLSEAELKKNMDYVDAWKTALYVQLGANGVMGTVTDCAAKREVNDIIHGAINELIKVCKKYETELEGRV